MIKYILILILIKSNAQRILIDNVKVITLKSERLTASRRTAPLSQLDCRGGLCHKYKIDTVQCENVGSDGLDANWKCITMDLPKNVMFKTLDVNCEGYASPQDRYILADSCSLRYNLKFRHTPNNSWFGVVLVLLILVLFAKGCTSGGIHPPPGGWNSVPTARPVGSGMGFWSGLGLGALAGNAYGGRRGYGRHRSRPSRRYGGGGGGRTATRRTTGFASTTRR